MMVALLAAYFAWRRRAMPPTTLAAVLLVLAAEWAAADALEVVGADVATKVFWSKIAAIGMLTVPLLWVLFVLRYTRQDSWLLPSRLAILWLLPRLPCCSSSPTSTTRSFGTT